MKKDSVTWAGSPCKFIAELKEEPRSHNSQRRVLCASIEKEMEDVWRKELREEAPGGGR